jgi:hypothetical protein
MKGETKKPLDEQRRIVSFLNRLKAKVTALWERSLSRARVHLAPIETTIRERGGSENQQNSGYDGQVYATSSFDPA